MNSNMQILGLILSILNYALVFLFIFNLLKVNYYNQIVSIFVKAYSPIAKIFSPLPIQALNILILAIVFKLSSLVIYFGDQYVITTLLGVAVIQTIMIILRIIFFAVIGGVILSWVSPSNSNAFLELIEEISYKSLMPIRNYIPSAGGLDFSPLFVFYQPIFFFFFWHHLYFHTLENMEQLYYFLFLSIKLKNFLKFSMLFFLHP